MEQISQLLAPYKETIGQVAGVVTVGQMFSVVFMLNDIRKRGKTTKDDPFLPYIAGVVLSLIGLRFGVALGDDALIRSNFFGVALNIIFVMFFYWYTPNELKNGVWRSIGLGGLFAGAIIAYGQYEQPELLASRFGLIMFTLIFCLTALPFLSLPEIIRTKSVAGLPFPLIFAGTIVGTSWLVYSLALNNFEMFVQNFVLVSMNVVVLSLFVIYPAKKVTKAKKSKKKNN